MKTITNKGFRQKLLSILMVLFVLFSVCSVSSAMSVTTYAIGGSNTSTPKENSGNSGVTEGITITVSVQKDIENFDKAMNATEGDLGKKTYNVKAVDGGSTTSFATILTGTNGTYTFSETEFNKLETKSQQAFITDLMNELKKSKYSSTITQEFSDGLSAADSNIANLLIPFVFDDLGADMATAYKWVAPVLSTLRVILGVLAIAVLLVLVLSTVLDCCYIGLPIARDMANKGNGSTEGTGNKKPFLISYDAFKTINETEAQMSGNDYKNPFGVYFKRRVVTYIILALCLFYLVAGEMSGLISWLLSLVSGITG